MVFQFPAYLEQGDKDSWVWSCVHFEPWVGAAGGVGSGRYKSMRRAAVGGEASPSPHTAAAA